MVERLSLPPLHADAVVRYLRVTSQGSADAGVGLPRGSDGRSPLVRVGADHLIRRDIQPRPLPAQSGTDLLKYSSMMRSKRRC